jgi:hypothetical protein
MGFDETEEPGSEGKGHGRALMLKSKSGVALIRR